MDSGKLSASDVKMLNPLVLAYAGDSVYDTFVRTLLISGGHGQVAKLHKMSIEFVKAKAQADILGEINELLTPEEQDIVRRGRNTKSSTMPKNADMLDYRYATGFEALIGYLYLTGQIDRLMEVIRMVINVKTGQQK
ncbi:MAG TPA: Mini-ribonuclease 3 [Bacillota bacterium]|nr:Mini-ribonuclease 3 [Bacillota bacterium]HRS21529.1 Mini-ribonuclease 3 [Clostridia bacterium]HQE66896.1 Mini-ribonuclease 3 [Bacillota bacterium]HQI17128.1 Mini-ribonuclease 3 [Bacillota bacterium]HQJ37313.1 Mini-ribonuclease 3 [Bacillota bacterium]